MTSPCKSPTSLVLSHPRGGELVVRRLVNPRARRISLRIDPLRREAVLTLPSLRVERAAAAFAAERASWIATELDRLPPARPFAPGTFVPVFGVEHRLEVGEGRSGGLVCPGAPPSLRIASPDLSLFPHRVRRWLQGQARRALEVRVAGHAAALGVRPSRILVRDLRSRWGSCTSQGVLSFSWRIIMAPPEVLDYLAAHEVAHLLEMNHSARFWSHVGCIAPQYRDSRAWLRRHGAGLLAAG